MKRRNSQLQLKIFRVEEFSRRLATLDEMKADLEKKLGDLEESVAREKQRAADSEIGRLAFPNLVQSIEIRRDNIRATMKELVRERAAVQDDLATATQDLRSFELAEQERQRRLGDSGTREAKSRTEHAALMRHLRKHSARQT
jgi:flagellar FliJ protein